MDNDDAHAVRKAAGAKQYGKKTCLHCLNDFSVLRPRNPNKYCGRACSYAARTTGKWGQYTNCVACGVSVTRDCRSGYCHPCYGKNAPGPWAGKKRPDMSQRLTGRKLSAVTRERLSASHIGVQAGDKHPLWKGGVSKEPGYSTTLFHQYKAKLLKNGGTHTNTQWRTLKHFYLNTCLRCLRSEPEITLHRDHIKPVSLGGSNDIRNIQPLCRLCNSIKQARDFDYRLSLLDLL